MAPDTAAPKVVHDDRRCASQRLESGVVSVDVPNTAVKVQVGVCVDCRHVIARRYTVTGPGTGKWVTLP